MRCQNCKQCAKKFKWNILNISIKISIFHFQGDDDDDDDDDENLRLEDFSKEIYMVLFTNIHFHMLH